MLIKEDAVHNERFILCPLGRKHAHGDRDAYLIKMPARLRENKHKGVDRMWGWTPPTKREVTVAIIFIIPVLPLLILNSITFYKIKPLTWVLDMYGEHIVQRVTEWVNKL